MTQPAPRPPAAPPRRGVRAPQALVAGLALVALAVVALLSLSDLSQGTLRAMGPAMLPRWLAVGVLVLGAALAALAFLHDGEGLGGLNARGPVFVVLGILAFALTIRPVALGPLTTPGLGLLLAGPLAVVIGGHATPEARLRDLLVLALLLTPACMVLFGDLLNLPIPMMPQALANLLPDAWSNDGRLRFFALVQALLGLGLLLLGRRAAPEASASTAPAREA